MVTTTEADFEAALLDLLATYKLMGFQASRRLKGMITRLGGVEAAENLLDPKKRLQPGFEELVRGGHPELTVEGLILDSDAFPDLFAEESLRVAYARLGKVGYTPRWRPQIG